MRTILHFFASLRVAFLLIAVLGLLSVVGTLVPQGWEVGEYLRHFPRAGFLILATGSDDLYHAWPFLGCLWLVAISAGVCTLTRWRLVQRKWGSRLALATVEEVDSMPVQADLPLGTAPAKDQAAGWQVRALDTHGRLLLRVKGREALLGGLLIHVGMLVILIGGVWGGGAAVEFPLRGAEGELLPVPPVEAAQARMEADRLGRQIRGYQQQMGPGAPEPPFLTGIRQRLEDLKARFQVGQTAPLFKLRVDRLWVDFHDRPSAEGASLTRNWNTQVSVIEADRPVHQAVIKVNEPLSWGGYLFYQTDWGQRHGKIRFQVRPMAEAGAASGPEVVHELVATVGARLEPDWSPYAFEVRQFFPDFQMDGGHFFSASDELNRPTALLEAIASDGTSAGRVWAFPQDMAGMASHFTKVPFAFSVTGVETGYETGLQVARDPGTPLVWTGCFLMSLGMFLSLYLRYVEHWLLIGPGGQVTLSVAGNRAPFILAEELAEVRRELTGEPVSAASPPLPGGAPSGGGAPPVASADGRPAEGSRGGHPPRPGDSTE